MACSKRSSQRFHAMDDAKEIWTANRQGSCGSKTLSHLDALVLGVSDEDANHKFLRFPFPSLLECKFKGSKEGSRQEAGRGQDFKPVRTEKEALMTIDEDSYNALQAKYDELQSEFGDQEAALTAHKLADRLESKEERELERKLAREAARVKSKRVVHAYVRQATPSWTNTNRAGSSRFNTDKQHVNSGSVHVNSGTQIKSGSSSFNTGKQNVNSGRVHVNNARENRPVLSNQTSNKTKISQVNLKSPKKCFSKQSSPVNRPFSWYTAYKSNKYVVKGKMGTAVKTSAGCVWRKAIPLSNTNSGPTQNSNVNVFRGPQGRPNFEGLPKREQSLLNCAGSSTKHMEHRVFFDSGYSGSKEVIDIDVQTEEAADLMVVTSTSLTEATRKASLKRFGEELQTKAPKRLKVEKIK
ncbi:hypothetical protein Tco_0368905 [Tanacetum coccineum]